MHILSEIRRKAVGADAEMGRVLNSHLPDGGGLYLERERMLPGKELVGARGCSD